MTEIVRDSFADESQAQWTPLSLRVPRPPALSRSTRVGLLASVVVLHGVALVWLLPLLETPRPAANEPLLVLDFLPAPEAVAMEVMVIPMPKPAADRPKTAPTQARDRRPSEHPSPRNTKPVPPLELYGADGRLKLPADMLAQIDSKFGDTRVFSYQIPGMEDSKKLFYRAPPVVYESTRFDQYWKPDQDLLTAMLTEMVKKTTKEVRIKLPGKSNSTVVCSVSLLAFGGGCGVLTPGSDWVGPVDDPNTLSEEEDRQCQVWWEQIVGAKTQDVWRQTRALYEESCRKPLERKPAG